MDMAVRFEDRSVSPVKSSHQPTVLRVVPPTHAHKRNKCSNSHHTHPELTHAGLTHSTACYRSPSMFSGLTQRSNCSSVTWPSATAASRRVVPVAWACSAILDALSYPMCGLSAVTSMSDSRSSWSTRCLLHSMPLTHLSASEREASASSRMDRSTLDAITGLNTLSCIWPLLPAMVTAVWLPITSQHTIVTASHCVGLTLPGMMELPGSLAGSCSSPMPQRGPLPNKRMSLAIFMSDVAVALRAPCSSTRAS
mmetsp:Transcript_26124/g.64907  ORF Transcript_26124/g.64907 Transcript_26124/m.64907 type:complete len:253 (-) Transcript_26124:938-1696(-)